MKIASLFIIAFSVIAIAGGFLSGSAAVPHISLHVPAPNPIASSAPVDVRAIRGLKIPQTDEVAYDDFAGDEAVVPDAASGDIGQDAQLSMVLVGCGHSPPLEAPFLALGIPVALVIDADGPAATQMAKLAAQNAGTVFYSNAALAGCRRNRNNAAHASGRTRHCDAFRTSAFSGNATRASARESGSA